MGVANAASGRGYAGDTVQPVSGATFDRPPAGNGDSQKGAFDACARLDGAAGREPQARICRQNAADMRSLN